MYDYSATPPIPSTRQHPYMPHWSSLVWDRGRVVMLSILNHPIHSTRQDSYPLHWDWVSLVWDLEWVTVLLSMLTLSMLARPLILVLEWVYREATSRRDGTG